MYDFLDRPVTELDDGGRFLIWSMRSWVKAMGDRICPATVVGAGFARWNMIGGLQPFLRMMTLFNRNGLETFQFCALPCNHVSEHEAIIVSLLCSLGDGRPETAHGTLALLVEDDSVGECLDALTALAGAMGKAAIYPSRGARQTGPSPVRRSR